MANEITVTGTLRVLRGNLQHTFTPSAIQANLDADTGVGGQQQVGASAEQLEMNADVLPYGWAYFRNLSSTISIEVDNSTNSATFNPFMRLNAGEYAICRMASTTLYARAITATGSTAATLQFQVFSP
jgi:hypothetical protein